MRYFNWKLAIVLVVASGVFAVAAFSLHRWQKSTKAERALPRGLKAYELKKWDEAADQLGRYLAFNSQRDDILVKYAEAQLNKRPLTSGNVQLAVTAYRTVLRRRPEDVRTTKQLLTLYLQMGGKAGDAKMTAQRCLEHRDDPAVRCMLAEALWASREFDRSAAELKKVIEGHSTDPNAITAYESIALKAEEATAIKADDRLRATEKTAQEWLDEAVLKNPDSALAYAARAFYHLRQHREDAAAADLSRATECDLSDPSVRRRVAVEFVRARIWEKAREQLEALRAASPADVGLWRLWADLAEKAGTPDEMYMVAEEGMKALGAEAWDFMPVATRLLIESGHLEKVGEYLSQMRNKEFDPAGLAFLEGLWAEKEERYGQAAAHWKQAVFLSPKEPERIPADAYVHLATVCARLGDFQSAISQLQILLSKRPEILNAQLLLAQLYAQDGNWSRLRDQAVRVQQMASEFPQVRVEAKQLELQGRVYLLTAEGAEAGAAEWPRLAAELDALDKETGGALAVKLLQVRCALARAKFAEAAALLTELEGEYPSDDRLMLLHAQLYVGQGDNAQAGALYREMIARSPQAYEPVRGLAVLLDRQDRRAECESVVKEAFARIQEPQSRRTVGQLLAEFYSRWQETEKRFQWLTDMAAQFPDDILFKRLLLSCEPVLQDAAAAQKIVDQIKGLDGAAAQWQYEQARWWMIADRFHDERPELDFKKNYPQIVKFLQENVSANPDDQASRLLLAEAYKMAGQQQLMLSAYREAYARDPRNVQVLVLTVTALQNAGEFAEAQSILDTIGQQDLDHPALQRLLVGSDVQRGDLTSASATLQQLIERDPNDVNLQLTYARVLILRKQFAEAEAILNDLKAKLPDSVFVARTQIRFYLQQGETEKAMQLCGQMVGRLNNAEGYMLRAETYMALQQNDKALDDLGKAVSMEPQNPAPWEARARIYGVLGRTAEAISDVRRALSLAPQEQRVQQLAVSLFIMSENRSLWDEAETMIDEALADQARSQGRGDPSLGVLKARILILRDTGPAVTEVRALLQRITTDYPKYVDAWALHANLELRKEEPSRALDIATRGLAHNDRNKQLLLLKAAAEKMLSPSMAALTTLPALAREYPDDVGIVIEWADAYVRAGQPAEAVKLLRQTMDQKQLELEGAVRRQCEITLAAALYVDGQREEAHSLFEALIAADSKDPTPVMILAHLLRREKRWTEVNQLLNLWRTRSPTDAATLTGMAQILASSGDRQALQMAEDQLRMILGGNPDAVPTLVLLAMLMQDAGRNEEASRLNLRVIALDPNHVVAINNLAWMLCDKPNPAPEAIREALDLANRGLKLVPDYIDLLDTRGVAYYHAGELEKAETDLLKSIGQFPANSPQSAAPQFHLARTYAAMNRRTQAMEHLKTAMLLNQKNLRLAEDHVRNERITHAIKLLKDAIALQEQMDQFRAGYNEMDLPGVRQGEDWTQARLRLDQLRKGQ